MTEWFAKLVGDEHTLGLLAEYLAGAHNYVLKDTSTYYLKIADLPEDTEPTILQETARQFIDLLNGAAKLYFGQFNGVTSHTVLKIRDDGKKEGFGFLTLRDRSTAWTLPPLPDGTFETWMDKGINSDAIARALTLYGTLEHNWKNLYMVLEVIIESIGGEVELAKTGLISQDCLKAFKHTANSFRAIGREARHAKSNEVPPSKPMSLKEAQDLIAKVLREWLQSKSRTS